MDLRYKIKPISEFESKWYRDAPDGAFILFPHPSIDDPNDAITGCPYPNVWIRFNRNENTLEFGIAFWSVPSVDQRFVNFAHNKNEKQRDRILAILKSVPENWLFRVYKKKRFGNDDIVYENRCQNIDSNELVSIISKIIFWRTQWKEETSDAKSWITPAVNLMRGTAAPDVSDNLIKKIFEVYEEISDMLPSKVIDGEIGKRKKELISKIEHLKNNRETSKFKDKIDLRITELERELAELG